VVVLSFQANVSDLAYTTDLLLHSNITTLRIPLRCFHGHLQVLNAASDGEVFRRVQTVSGCGADGGGRAAGFRRAGCERGPRTHGECQQQ
jgi:hypothetical protein